MTDGPDDILRGLIEGGSEGPEATPKQEAFVSGLLGSLRRDDPPMPDDVIRRLDAVLAEERRTGAPVLGVIPGGADATGAEAPASLPGNVSVLPTAAERRGPSMRSFRVLGGLAAAAVVVVGGATVISNGGLGGSGTSGGAASGGSPVAASITDTGTAYSANTFADQAVRLADQADEKGAPPEQAPESPQPAATEGGATDATSEPATTSTASAVVEPLTAERALLCTKEISDGTVTEPLLVDQGTYNGRDAEVYVLPSIDDPAAYDVIVVAAGCTTGQSELLNFRRVIVP